MDWSSVFDEVFPEPGATDAIIEQFVAGVSRPMSATEVSEVNAGQSNPFPPTDRLFPTWRPFDARAWSIPDRLLPPSYLSLLRWCDGGEFRTGERWFQFFPTLDPSHGVRAMMLAYHLPQYMPGALPVAFNGGGTFYLLDMRQPPVDGEYPVVCSHAGNLGWELDECFLVDESLLAACRGRTNIDDLRFPDARR